MRTTYKLIIEREVFADYCGLCKMTNFGELLKDKRIRRGLTQKKLSFRCRERSHRRIIFHDSLLSRWENGRMPLAYHRDILLTIGSVLHLQENEMNSLLTAGGLSPVQAEDTEYILTGLVPKQNEINHPTQYSAMESNKVPLHPGSIDLSIIQWGRREINYETGECARLVAFRIGNITSDIVVIERICLEVIEARKSNKGLSIEGVIEPYRYDFKLSLSQRGKYPITDKKFKFSKNDLDDFEILFTSKPGMIYRVQVVVHYSNYPQTEVITMRSEEIRLQFPKTKRPIVINPITDFKLIHAQPQDYLRKLVDFLENTTIPDDGQLILYVDEPISHELRNIITQKMIASGVELNGNIGYDSGIAVIRFKHGRNMVKAFSTIDIPGLFGWHLADYEGKILFSMSKYLDSWAKITNNPEINNI